MRPSVLLFVVLSRHRPLPSLSRHSPFQTLHENRQYSETEPHFLSPTQLGNRFGERVHWSKDLALSSAMEDVRHIYHELLPTYADLYKHDYTMEQLAEMTSHARTSAKLYARRISPSIMRWLAELYDGVRHWRRYGRWCSSGMTYDEIWEKYEKQVLDSWNQDYDPDPELIRQRTAELIVRKSCTTNTMIDRLCSTKNENPQPSDMKVEVATTS